MPIIIPKGAKTIAPGSLGLIFLKTNRQNTKIIKIVKDSSDESGIFFRVSQKFE
jgi:hypothetical protein